jgi:hypothetical protein
MNQYLSDDESQPTDVALSNVMILNDNNWMLDLVMKVDDFSKREFTNELAPSIYYQGNFPIDGFFYTHPADL